MGKKRVATGKNSPERELSPEVEGVAKPASQDALALRERAEKLSRESRDGSLERLDDLSPEALRTSLHELSVHKIELEMQREELLRAQEKLSASRSHYFDLYDLAPVGYVTTSERGLTLKANHTAASLLGATRADLEELPIFRFIHREDQDIYYMMQKQLMKTREPQARELRMVRPDGTAIWTNLQAAISQDEGGEPTCRFTFNDITARKQKELVSARLAAIVRSSDDAIISMDLNGIVTTWNHGAEKLFGYTSVEMEGTSILRLIPTDRQHEERDILEKSRGGNLVDHFETLRQAKDGRLLDVSITSSPIRDAAGAVIGVSKVARDITERKRMESLLRKSEEKHRCLFESMMDGFVSVAMDGKILEFNEPYQAMLGYSKTELAQLTYTDITPEKWHAFEADIVENQILKRGYSDVYEKEYRRKDGSIFPVELHAVLTRDEHGSPTTIWSLIRDVTLRKRTEAALQEKERLLSESQRIAHIGGWAWAFTGPIQWTDETYRLYGVSPETFTPTIEALIHLVHPEDRPLMQEWVRACSVGEKPAEHEFRCVWPDGTVRFLSGRGELIYDAGNRPAYLFGTVQDITLHKRAEEELLKKNAELESFTYTVSHDLKSPLVTIKTFLGYLEEDLKTNKAETVAKDLGYLHRAADKMELLLNELLKLARIGHTRNAPELMPLQEIVGEALELVAGQIAERGVQVEVTKEPVWLHGDRQRLVQLFQNLVDNAVKFLGDQPAPRIDIGVEQEGGKVVLFVRDNGKGIDQRHWSKLFGLFEKLDPHTPGTGMGLATARRIVEMHGGTIQAQSDGPGKGSTFRFTLAKTERK